MDKIVYTHGNIIGQDGNNMALDYCCKVDDENLKKLKSKYQVEEVPGDIIFTKDNSSKPYVIYCAKNGLSCKGKHVLYCTLRPKYSYEKYKEDIKKIENLYKNKIECFEDVELINKLLYLGVFAAYECYIIDILTGMILGDQKNLNSFVTDNKIVVINEQERWSDACLKIRELPQANAKQICKIFEKYAGLFISEDIFFLLKIFYKHRNNIAHRGGYAKDYAISYKSIEISDLTNLIDTCNKIVEYINSEISKLGIDYDIFK